MTQTRRTVAGTAAVSGVGIHSGAETTLTFRPSNPTTGIAFRRTDLGDAPTIAALVENVADVERRTSLGNGDVVIHTVEHVLAAVTALGIDDLLIEIDGPEVPIGDGSAEAFVRAIAEAGIRDVEGTPTVHRIGHPFTVRDGDAEYVVAPADGCRLTVTIEVDHPVIGRQSGSYDITPDRFCTELAAARTFGFASEAQALRDRGLALAASEDNTIVLSDQAVTGTELRWRDEFVRHKTLDLLGDLALLGARFEGEVFARVPSHLGNVALVRAIKRVGGMRVPPVFGIQDILGVLPHRYPLLLVDRIVEVEEGKRIVGLKNVTVNEPFFQGHFPGHPVMPGVLIVEAMAQAGGMLLMGAVENPQDKVVYFMSIDNVKFRRPVVPGDQILFELEMLHFRGRNCRMRGVGYVDGKPVAEAEMMARIVDR